MKALFIYVYLCSLLYIYAKYIHLHVKKKHVRIGFLGVKKNDIKEKFNIYIYYI